MGDLSPHFSRHEFACSCNCGFDTVDTELLVVLETIRDRFGKVTPTSGCRCPAHNAAEGGGENSQHLYARACDFVVEDVPAHKVQDFIDNTWPDRYGLGKYDGWTHVDTRRNRARWTG